MLLMETGLSSLPLLSKCWSCALFLFFTLTLVSNPVNSANKCLMLLDLTVHNYRPSRMLKVRMKEICRNSSTLDFDFG